MEVNNMSCCGLKELHRISSVEPEQVIHQLCRAEFDDIYWDDSTLTTGAFIFTQAGRSRYGDRLAAYIEKHKLGEVDRVPSFKNRNTGRTIHLFVWRFNYQAMEKWWKLNYPPDPDDEIA